jgi:hypothetical protein
MRFMSWSRIILPQAWNRGNGEQVNLSSIPDDPINCRNY